MRHESFHRPSRAVHVGIWWAAIAASVLLLVIGSEAWSARAGSDDPAVETVAGELADGALNADPQAAAQGDRAAPPGDVSAQTVSSLQASLNVAPFVKSILGPSKTKATIVRAGTWTKTDGKTELGYVMDVALSGPVSLTKTEFPSIDYDEKTDTYRVTTYVADVTKMTSFTVFMNSAREVVDLVPGNGSDESPGPGQDKQSATND